MENFLPAQQVCAVQLVQPHMMLGGSCLCLLLQKSSLRCHFLLASSVWQLWNRCLHCGCGLSSNAFSRSSDCSFLSRYKSNCGEMGICSLNNLSIELASSALSVYPDLCAYRDSRPVFHKTNPWRMSLQVSCAKQWVQLQGFCLAASLTL